MGPKALAASRLCNLDSEAMTSLPPPPPTPPPPTPPSPQPPQAPRPRNARATRKAPHGVLEVDWPFFGEMCRALALKIFRDRSEEHTSELQSRQYLVCRLLLEKKKRIPQRNQRRGRPRIEHRRRR